MALGRGRGAQVPSRALSGSSEFKVDTQEIGLHWGDRRLLCSNGVFTMLDDDQTTVVPAGS